MGKAVVFAQFRGRVWQSDCEVDTMGKSEIVLLFFSWGGVRGLRKPQNCTEIRQKTQTASDFSPNTEMGKTVNHIKY